MVLMMALDASDLAPRAACVRLTRSLAQGQAPIVADLVAAPCAPPACGAASTVGAARVWRYGQGALRARRALVQGQVVCAPPSGLVAAVAAGQALRISVRAGPVVIERQVTAVQSARVGQDVLVRDADGEVFAVAAKAVAP